MLKFKKIAEEERENKEATAKWQCPRTFKETMQQTVDASAKKAVEAGRQKGRKAEGPKNLWETQKPKRQGPQRMVKRKEKTPEN